MPCGTIVVPSGFTVLNAGKPMRVYGASVGSTATPASAELKNGDQSGNPTIVTLVGTASQKVLVGGFPAEGIFFPAGLFVNFDGNTTGVVIFGEQVKDI